MDRILDITEYTRVAESPMTVSLTSGSNPTSLRLIERAQASPYYVSHTHESSGIEDRVIVVISSDLATFVASLA
jgi:hypothetical protein